MNYFIFIKDGVEYDSRDYGIGCGGFPEIVKPIKRVTKETLDGRSGSLIVSDNCYDSYQKNIECYMRDDVYKDLSWLDGSGQMILSNELNRVYDVTITNNIELSQIANYWRNFFIRLEVQPFKKGRENHSIIKTEKNFSFNVGGNAVALPKISISGVGTINLLINENAFIINDLESEKPITIDSELEIVQTNKMNTLNKTNGDFPKLLPGENIVEIIGDLSEISINYKDTYL